MKAMPKIRLPKVNFKSIFRSIGKAEATYRPQILAGVSVAALWTAMGLTYKAAPKIQEELDLAKVKLANLEPDEVNERKEVKKHAVIEVAKNAAAPVATGIIGSAAMIASTSVSAKRLAAVSAVLSSREATLNMYREYIKNNVGKYQDDKIKAEIAKDQVKQHPPKPDEVVYNTGNGDKKFMDPWTGAKFWSSAQAVREAFLRLSYQLKTDEYVTLNDLYYKLGLPEVKSGDILGWTIHECRDEIIDIDFTAVADTNGDPVGVLQYEVEVLPYYRDKRRISSSD